MKKKFCRLVVIAILSLACFASLAFGLAACGHGGEYVERTGKRCYIDIVQNNNCSMEFFTDAPDYPHWVGVEEGDNHSSRYFFIKGDVISFTVFTFDDRYYLDDDFGLEVNGQSIPMTKHYGLPQRGFPFEVTYFTGTYKIESDIVVQCKNVSEKTINCSLTAKTFDEIFDGENLGEIETNKEQFIKDHYYTDNSLTVRFADKDIFGLEKDTWGLNELREYLLTHAAHGKVGVASGAVVYVYSQGYTVQCENIFTYNMQPGDAVAIDIDYVCYANEQDNEYGYKFYLMPSRQDDDSYIDGQIILIPIKPFYCDVRLYGSLQDLDKNLPGFVEEDAISDIFRDNNVFAIKYGDKDEGNVLEVSDFADGKVNVQIRLKLYSQPNWKTLYDKMSIKVIDKTLKNGTDFTISPNGIINLVLDKPYKYYNALSQDEVPEYYVSGDKFGWYMYNYNIHLDIIKLARDAGLLVPIDTYPNCGKVYFGGRLYSNSMGEALPLDSGFHGNVGYYNVGYEDEYEKDAISKCLFVKGSNQQSTINNQENFSKMKVTRQDGSSFVVDVVSAAVNESGYDSDVPSPYDEFNGIVYQTGKEAAALKAINSEGKYNYYIKVLVDLQFQKIEFYN